MKELRRVLGILEEQRLRTVEIGQTADSIKSLAKGPWTRSEDLKDIEETLHHVEDRLLYLKEYYLMIHGIDIEEVDPDDI